MSAATDDSPSEEPETVFGTLPAHFPQLKTNDKIKTCRFLEASEGVIILVEKFGKVFGPVVYDMNGNIKKIRERYELDKESNEFLEDMIMREKSAEVMTAVDALQWLRRGLHFISKFFECLIEDANSGVRTQDLAPIFKSAYKDTLQRYHGWLGGQLFNIMSKFAPTRRHLILTLSLDKPHREQFVLRDMQHYLDLLMPCVHYLMKFYQDHDLETSYTV